MTTLDDWRKRRPGNREYQDRLLAEMEREAMQVPSRPSVAPWLTPTGRPSSTISTAEVLATLDGWRGERPDADR